MTEMAQVFPVWMLEEWTDCGIDNLDPAKSYNVTGTHLKQILQAYRRLVDTLAFYGAEDAFALSTPTPQSHTASTHGQAIADGGEKARRVFEELHRNR
jgi:hypothetical protein